jgi:CheY-like chemotaxis protein
MKILFLDDQEERQKIFRHINKDHDIVGAYTSEEAILLLEKHSPFDMISLDHDLGGIYLPSDENSGYAVAEFISKMDKKLLPENIVIHSWNERGALNMMDVLKKAEIKTVYKPFELNQK